MFDHVRIVLRGQYIAVYDYEKLIHGGNQSIDGVFATKVWEKMEKMGYTPYATNNEVYFYRENKNVG